NAENKVFYYTSDIDPPLISRKVELVDNVIPGSNSAMAKTLYDLSLLLYNETYKSIAKGMLQQMQNQLLEENTVSYYANWWQLYFSMSESPFEIAIVGKDYQSLKKQFHKQYLPNALFLGGPTEGGLTLLQNKLQAGETYIYVCKDKLCKLPVQNVAAALQQMGKN
ncbi:MAG: thioredoxin domain-containing protein, partial [Bacteroidota bacterium]